MPEGDEEGLEACVLPREAVLKGGSRWILIHDFTVPDGYICRTATSALRIPPSYSDDQIDIAYFATALSLASGLVVAALSLTMIDGKPFQQCSRYRIGANPWRPGLDDLGTHLL